MAYSYKSITNSLKTLNTVIRTGIKNYSAKATKNSPRILIKDENKESDLLNSSIKYKSSNYIKIEDN